MSVTGYEPVPPTRCEQLQRPDFRIVGIGCTFVGLLLLGLFLADIVRQGAGRLSPAFLTNLPSRFPAWAGIFTALVGSFYILLLTALLAVPVGIGAGLYLEAI